jgi:predicted acylesterase/phospholipase RssA
MPEVESAVSCSIGLALSGGGFRATLFHLGVVRFLYEVGLLKSVTHVTSVSGGSILAAHLVLNWEKYKGDPEQFEEAAREIVAFTQCDVRGRVVRPWLASWAALGLPRVFMRRYWWRTSLLQRCYDRLYHGATLKDLKKPGRPLLHILATSMTTGQLVSFGKCAMLLNCEPVPDRHDDRRSVPADNVPVSLAVVASSAFPPLFPPIRVSHETFGAPEHLLPNPHYLTDGGVFDNLGIRKLHWLKQEQTTPFQLVVMSNAQREFALELANEYNTLAGRTTRSVDLLMDRVSRFECDSVDDLCRDAGSQILECQLHRRVDTERSYALSATDQFAVQNTRTDLDAFTDGEVDALIHQGSAVARAAWEDGRASQRITVDAQPPAPEVWHPLRPAPSGGYQLRRVNRRRFGLFAPGFAATWALFGLPLVYIVSALGYVAWLQNEAATQKARSDRIILEQKAREDREKKQREHDEKEMQLAIQHVGKKIRIVESLADLASAAAPDEWDLAKARWDDLLDEMQKSWSPWYYDKLVRPFQSRINEELTKADEGGWGAAELKVVALDVARKAREYIENTPVESKFYGQVLYPKRKDWYDEAVSIVRRFCLPNYKHLKDTRVLRRQFWSLYFGKLALVEGDEVKDVMKNIGDKVKGWESAGEKDDTAVPPAGFKEGIQRLADRLKRSCNEELRQTR